jgi:hypothetical protein
MNEIWGKEPTINPPIIIAPIAETLVLETARSSTEPRTPSPMPSPEGMDDMDSPFNTGKKVKQKKNNPVADEVLDAMSDHLAIKTQELEEKRKEREERKKEREERKVQRAQLEEAIIKAQESSAKMMDSVTMFMGHMMNRE